ncbi:MAG: 6-hydroxymethylpterin diphosphokinase MptE-like protein [Chlamydiota bacterium]
MDQSVFVHNRILLEKKCPELSFFLEKRGKYSSSCLQEETTSLVEALEASSVVYASGLIHPRCFPELQRFLEKKTLIFCLRDPGHLLPFLMVKEASFFLEHPRVFITPIDAHFYQTFSEKFPVEQLGIVHLAKDPKEEQELFATTLRRMTTYAHLLQTDRLYGHIPFQNFWENLIHIPRSKAIHTQKGFFKEIPAVICGAGSSLEEAYPSLRSLREKALLVAGGSSIAALSYANIEPHLGIFVDPNEEEYDRLKKNRFLSLPTLYTPRLFPKCFSFLQGELGYLLSSMGLGAFDWLESTLNTSGQVIGEELTKDSLSVTLLAAAACAFLGCSPIILVGVDLAYTQKKRYAKGVLQKTENVLPKSRALYEATSVTGEKIWTTETWLMEKRAFEHLQKKTESVFINASKGVSMQEIKSVDLSSLPLKPQPIDRKVQELFKKALPMGTKDQVDAFKTLVKKSLLSCHAHTKILASNRSFAHKALAEIALEEEAAYRYLFYDSKEVLARKWPRASEEELWRAFSHLIEKYLAVTGRA